MNRKRRIFRLILMLLSLAALLVPLTACRKESGEEKEKQEDERYTATATVWVVGSSSSSVGTAMPAGNTEVMTALINDCKILMTADSVLEEVIARCEASIEVDELRDMIRISNENDTRVLTVSVLSLDADEACLLVNTLVDVGCEHIEEVCGDPVARIWAYAESAM